MSSTSESSARANDGSDTEPRVLLFMQPHRDRELLADTLGKRYAVHTTTEFDALESTFDCCVLDEHHFRRHADEIRERNATDGDVALPFVLLVEDLEESTTPSVWDYVDDVVEMPVPKAALVSRVENVVDRRRTAVELSRRKAQLEETLRDLELKERALEEAPVGLTITGPPEEDTPLTYANERFEEMTGYDSSTVQGRNCRFLQGDETSAEPRAQLRAAIEAAERESVELLNYRQSGEKFWNRVEIAPIHDQDGAVTNYVGFQRDVTERKIRERRLEVLNRVLSHNLRNKMNIIEGHGELLRSEFDADEVPVSLTKITDAAADLGNLADAVRKIERTISDDEGGACAFALDDRISGALSGFEDRFPDVTFAYTVVDEGPYDVDVTGLMTAIEEAVENAVEHNDSADPSVTIRLTRPSDDWIDIEIEDNGPGIPEREIEVLERGETSVNHADRLGFWLIYWVVSKAGGRFSVADAEPTGSVVSLSVPAAD